MRSLARTLAVGSFVLVLLGFSGCALTELKNTNKRLKEANDRLVSENNRLEQELAMSERELAERNREIAMLKDASSQLQKPAVAQTPARIPRAGNEMEDIGVESEITPQGTLLRLDEAVFFALGKATLSTEGQRKLDAIAGRLNSTYRSRIIRVEGHTDNVPVVKQRHIYPSNWELSTARACTVVRYLVERAGVSPKRIYPAGYGEFRPRLANTSATSRSKNRRVEILILNEPTA